MQNLDASLLTGLPPFRDCNREQIDRILSRATARRYDEGSTVFSEGEQSDRFFLLLDGHIRVVRTTPDGEQVIARYIAGGELFGIAPALGLTHYPASAICADECLALCWPTTLWEDFCARNPGFATNTYILVGQRLKETNDRVVELATQHVERRVAQTLLRLAHQTGRETPQGILIDMPITRQDLSEMTGTTLHTVSRLLSAWGKEKTVISARRKVTVSDPHRLLLIAEGRN